MLVTYTDASFANAEYSSSQLGVLVCLTRPEAKSATQPVNVLDWRSCRSQRVCRSALASESSAADEGADRAAYANMMLSEILYNIPAHRAGCKLNFAECTDAKSLYDCITNEAPNTTDKRSLINIRAVQETVAAKDYHWVPTTLMFADGLTKYDPKLREIFSCWLQRPFTTLKDQQNKDECQNHAKAFLDPSGP